jgi:4-diphosphocytidyl-2-C-methyl-D-erythritol kinase
MVPTRRDDFGMRIAAPAKLTLTLRITGVRDDGYHLIDAEMVSLTLADELEFADTEGPTSIRIEGRFADGVPADGSNLVAKALQRAGRTAAVTIRKNIPHGGGLGGGSTDAAAALRWAGWSSRADDLERASEVGADVAFCLAGGRARVRGIGEIVEPLPHVDRTVTLVVPPLRVSTPAVYQAWDDIGGPTGPGQNDLEPAAIAVEPELARWRDLIGDACGRTPILAGSGATWFVHGEHSNALAAVGNEGAVIVVAATSRSSGASSATAGSSSDRDGCDGRTD